MKTDITSPNILSGKVVVVTGGAGLLGKTFCRAIAASGGIAVVADIDKDRAEAAADEIRTECGDAKGHVLDITSAIAINALIHTVQDTYGRIGAVVNNAYPRGPNYGRKVEQVEYEDFCASIDRHLGGYFLVMQQFSMYFTKTGCGNIINIGSIYGSMAPRFEVYDETPMTMPVEYAAIKSGVAHLSRYFAQYYKKQGIRVNTLSPGGIFDHQPEHFLGRYMSHSGRKGMLDGSDIVGTLLFLLSDASKHVTGQEIIVDDGFSL